MLLLLLSLELLPRLVPHCADWWHLATHQEVHLQPAAHSFGATEACCYVACCVVDLTSSLERVNTAMTIVIHCNARGGQAADPVS